MPGIRIEPSAYVVCGLHPDDPDSSVWTLTIERKAPDRWAVMFLSRAYNRRTGEFDWEPIPSERTDAYKRTHRFPFDEAWRIALEAYPKLVINGLRVVDGKLVNDLTGEPIAKYR